MVLLHRQRLDAMLKSIELARYYHLPLLAGQQFKQFIEAYGQAKWQIIDLLNKEYQKVLPFSFDLVHWLYYQEEDEVAYFLNEAGSNCLAHSLSKRPQSFHLWLGRRGFVIAIEQEYGFDAKKAAAEKQAKGGGGFSFFRSSKSVIFFDRPESARVIYFGSVF